MRDRFVLSFPYLCAALIVGLIIADNAWDGGQHRSHGAKVAESSSAHAEHMQVAQSAAGIMLGSHEAQAAQEAAPGAQPTATAEDGEHCSGGSAGALAATGDPRAGHAAAGGEMRHVMEGLPAPVYYAGVAFILILSFFVIEHRAGRERAHPSSAPRPRFDLLTFAPLRRLLVHPATRPVSQLLMVAIFLVIIAAGLFGTQLPTKNIAPLLTWTVWWCGLVLLVLYLGKAWCYVCPWDALSGWAEGLRLWSPKKESLSLGLRWPRWMRNIWPATILFVGLTWLELGFGVTMNPRATAWLALLMLGLAFTSAFIFDRRSFCRYGCLVGRISGLYALFSPIEVRARDKDVCRSCATHSCYKGNEAGEACPTFQFLPTMEQNTYCISCMECVKTCEEDNVALNMRPWGEDLLLHRKPRSDEAYLALLMLALTGFHGLTMTPGWRDMVESLSAALGIGETLAFSIGMVTVMVGPIALYALLVAISRWFAGVRRRGYYEYFMRYAYALLPIAVFYHLAHNSEHLLMEGQRLLALVSDPFGFQWDLFGTAWLEPQSLVSMQTLWAIQVLLVVMGHVYSLWAARHAAVGLMPSGRAIVRSQLPMLGAMIMFSTMSLWLLKQPMEMRMSLM